MQEVLVVPAIQQYFQEQAHDLETPSRLEPPVGGVNAAGDDPKLPAGKLLGQEIVFGIERAFVEAAKLVKSVLFEKHEHSGAERLDHHGTILGQIASYIKDMVGQRAVAAPYIGGDTL